ETPEWNWLWRDEDSRVRYYNLRTDSERAFRNFKLALGTAAINRLISIINVLRLSKGGAGWDISAFTYPDGENNLGFSLKVNINHNIFSQRIK
ncbi:hypothetical protein DRQ29_02075, partial [bacterium]